MRGHPGLLMYTTASLLVLCGCLLNEANPEASLLLTILMVVLTFPAGLLVVTVLAVAARLFGPLSPPVLETTTTWLLLATAGFLQWGYLAPWVLRKLRSQLDS